MKMRACSFLFFGLLLGSLFGVLPTQQLSAQPTFRGGDLTYECLGTSGVFRFTAGVYITCPGVNPFKDSLALFERSMVPGAVPVFRGWLRYDAGQSYSIADSSAPRLAPLPLASCQSSNSIIKDVRRMVFVGDLLLDTVPVPAAGYVFFVPHVSEALAVVGGVNGGLPSRALFPTEPADNMVVGAVGPTARLAAKMLGYGGLRPQYICDASPSFYNDPNPLFIANANNFVADSVTVTNMAVESNFYDSISYHLGGPIYDTNLVSFPVYNTGIAFNTATAPAGLFNLNSLNGEFSFKPLRLNNLSPTRYHWGITVRSWRCNSLLSEVYREFVAEVITRPSSGQFPPFLENQKPPYFTSNSRFFREFYVEDTLSQSFLAVDDVPFGLPPGTDNYLSIGIQSPYLNAAAASGSGTPRPGVCSTASALPFVAGRTDVPTPQILSNNLFTGYGYAQINSTLLRFGWISRCDSVFINQCYNHARVFPFLVTAGDYTPPLLGKQSRIFSVRLRNLPALPAPTFYGVSVGDQNDRVRLYFRNRIDTSTIDPLDSLNNALDTRGLTPAQLKVRSVNRRLSSFNSYQVYRSILPTGPWVLVGSVTDPFADFFEDNDPNLRLDAQDYYYKIWTLSGCDINLRYDESVVIKTFGGNHTNDKANMRGILVWDTMGIANTQFLTDSSYMQRRYPALATWDSLKIVEGPRIDSTLPFLFCNDSLHYRLGVYDNGTGIPGMVYWSRWILAKYILPDSMRLKYVSVDTTGIGDGVQIAWYPEVDTLRDFVEFRFSPIAPGQLPLLTVPNRDPVTLELDSFYQGNVGLSASDPNFQAILLSSVDTCLNVGGGSVPHRVVNVEAVAEPCLNRVLLGWREYEGWDDLLYYLVYRQDPGQGYVLRDTVLGSSYSDIDPTLTLGNVYRYLVVACNARGFRSHSNLDTALYDIPEPVFSYIESASVDSISFNSVWVRFNIPENASIGKLELMRKDGPDASFRLIDTMGNPSFLTGAVGTYRSYLYNDTSARTPDKVQYTYRVIVYDACYLLSDTSQDFTCLFLVPGDRANYLNLLKWNSFDSLLSFNGEVDSFIVYRNATGSTTPFFGLPRKEPGALPPWKPFHEYGDAVDNIPSSDGLFDYFIVAVEKDNQWEFKGRAISNKITIRQEPRAFFPTAVLGGSTGGNGEFKPSFNYRISGDSLYYFKIMSRWGKVILETRNVDLGWKGYVGEIQDESAEKALQDTYIYELRFTGADGKTYNFKGNLTLLWKD